MSLVDPMYTAATGLQAHADAMSVVSDNIANVNTTGFKSSTARFEDLIATTSSSTVQVGQGATLGGVDTTFTQGALVSTGRVTDLALQGDGFFVVQGNYQGQNNSYYTRAGQFYLDNSGSLVNAQGLNVQGYLANSSGQIQSQVGSLNLGVNSLIPPQESSNISIVANVNSESTAPAAFNAQSPSTTSNFSTSVTVYDSRGEAHNIDVYFRNTGAGNTWEWHALAQGSEITGGTAGQNVDAANGTLTFGTNGSLTSVTTAADSFNFLNATQAQTVAFNFGDPTSTGGTGLAGVTSYAGSSSVSSITQNGYASGALSGISVGSDGTIQGTFTNGANRVLGQVAIASFANEQGLVRGGASLYAATVESGAAAVGAAGTSGRGSIASGSLEQSNVNLSQEFISLMAYQRGFEANTRSVSASEKIFQSLIMLGR